MNREIIPNINMEPEKRKNKKYYNSFMNQMKRKSEREIHGYNSTHMINRYFKTYISGHRYREKPGY
jgi:hypothetical protein